jgi:hypothetical protein
MRTLQVRALQLGIPKPNGEIVVGMVYDGCSCPNDFLLPKQRGIILETSIVEGRRTRSSDTVLELANDRVIRFCAPTSDLTLSYTGGRAGIYRIMTDVVTPRYTTKIAQGEIVNNPCHSTKVTYSVDSTGYEHYFPGYPGLCSSNPGGAWKDTNPSLLGRIFGALDWKGELAVKDNIPQVDMDSEASTKALSYVKAPDVDSLVSIAEMREAFRTIRNPIKAFTDLTRKYQSAIKTEKRRQKKRAQQLRIAQGGTLRRLANKSVSTADERALLIAKGAGNQYLTWLYGIRPIMQDVDGTLDALFHQEINERYTARGSSKWSDQTVDEVTTSIGNPLTSATMRRTVTIEATHRAGLLYQHNFDLGDRLGLQATQVPAALWELVPFSFVVDWAVNVGETIQALTAAATTRPLAQWITRKHKITVQREIIATGFNPNVGYVITQECQDKDSVIIETYDRYPNVRLWANIALRTRIPLNADNSLAALSLILQKL